MNLFEKIELFYKMAQQLEASPLESDPIASSETIENTQEFPEKSAAKKRMAKLARLVKGS